MDVENGPFEDPNSTFVRLKRRLSSQHHERRSLIILRMLRAPGVGILQFLILIIDDMSSNQDIWLVLRSWRDRNSDLSDRWDYLLP